MAVQNKKNLILDYKNDLPHLHQEKNFTVVWTDLADTRVALA